MLSLDGMTASKHFHGNDDGRWCQTNVDGSRKAVDRDISGGKLAPFGQSRGSVLLECFSAVQVTFVAEVIVDR